MIREYLRTVVVLIAAVLICYSAAVGQIVQATPTAFARNIQIGSQIAFGMDQTFPNTIFQYQEPSTTTATMQASTVVSIPANSTNNAVSIASLFPGWNTPVIIGLQEITDPGVNINVGLSSGGPRLNLQPGGFVQVRTRSGKPTFYIDNPDLTNDALVQVFGLSN